MQRQVELSNGRNVYVDVSHEDRIRAHSARRVNRRIEEGIVESIRKHANSDYQELSQRIDKLEREWDLDRALMAFFSTVGGTVLTLGLRHDKRWFNLLALQFGFLGYHAVAGWCPPVSLLRQLGFRTVKEIDAEKYALKTMRGDFKR